MKTNEVLTSAEICDQVSFEDCKVKKVDPPINPEGNNERDGYYRITSLHKDDLKEVGFDMSKVTDEQMSKLALRMAEDYSRRLFWNSLEAVANEMGLPRLKYKKLPQ